MSVNARLFGGPIEGFHALDDVDLAPAELAFAEVTGDAPHGEAIYILQGKSARADYYIYYYEPWTSNAHPGV